MGIGKPYKQTGRFPGVTRRVLGFKVGSKRKKGEKMDDQGFLEFAIAAAREGGAQGGVPIGGALVVDGKVLGVGFNKRVQQASAIRHGETDCLENIGRLPVGVYRKATMYTTLSPCHMCSGAILLYGIPRVVLGENETFMGAEDLLRSHGVEVINLNSQACKDLMAKFISEKPEVWNEDIGEE